MLYHTVQPLSAIVQVRSLGYDRLCAIPIETLPLLLQYTFKARINARRDYLYTTFQSNDTRRTSPLIDISSRI